MGDAVAAGEQESNQGLEAAACVPAPILPEGFNLDAHLPYGLTPDHIYSAMREFLDFLALINEELYSKGLNRLESMLMPAGFSSLVGEFMVSAIPKHSPGLVKNRHHNGYPDLLPTGRFPNNAAQHGNAGIEVKASRYLRGWQGHNAEAGWLMVFVFESNRPDDTEKGVPVLPFRILKVYAAELEFTDWKFAGRTGTSRRTITASVAPSGFAKMASNWVYSAF
jgi:hypothetical protein